MLLREHKMHQGKQRALCEGQIVGVRCEKALQDARQTATNRVTFVIDSPKAPSL